jgi:hypothetical protein
VRPFLRRLAAALDTGAHDRIVPVLGLQRDRGSLEPPTTSGQPITDNAQIELGAVTLRQLGKHIGDTVMVGRRPYRRPLTISGIVTLPSFGVAISHPWASPQAAGRGTASPDRSASRRSPWSRCSC